MYWLTLRRLKAGTAESRKKAAHELWREPNPSALKALSEAALTDADAGVRKMAAAALGRVPDDGRYEPLLRALKDSDTEVIKSAMLGLRRAVDERVIRSLVPLLRHRDFTVRVSAAQTIDTIRWTPANKDERVWFQVAKGWYSRAAAAGADAINALQLTVQTGPVHAAMRAVESLAAIPEAAVVRLLCSALSSSEPVVSIAAADALGKIGGVEAVGALTHSLRSGNAQLRAASVQALGRLGAAETTGLICGMLTDKQWEVRLEAAAALGKFKNSEALDPLAKALEDQDADVREAAAIALGKIRDRRSIPPLVLALKDEVTSVRRIAAASLSRIDPDWITLPETKTAAEKLKVAVQDADAAVRYFVAQFLINLGELPADALAGFAPDEQMASPAEKRKRMAAGMFVGLLQDADRDIRQAAAEALGQLGGARAQQALTRLLGDPDGDVVAATKMALQALAAEPAA